MTRCRGFAGLPGGYRPPCGREAETIDGYCRHHQPEPDARTAALVKAAKAVVAKGARSNRLSYDESVALAALRAALQPFERAAGEGEGARG